MIVILRWALSGPFDYPRIFFTRCVLIDTDNVDLMKPFIAEIEPVTKSSSLFKSQRIDCRILHTSQGIIQFRICSEWKRVNRQSVEGTLSQQKFIHVLIPSVKCLEDRMMEVLRGPVTPDPYRSRDHILVEVFWKGTLSRKRIKNSPPSISSCDPIFFIKIPDQVHIILSCSNTLVSHNYCHGIDKLSLGL